MKKNINKILSVLFGLLLGYSIYYLLNKPEILKKNDSNILIQNDTKETKSAQVTLPITQKKTNIKEQEDVVDISSFDTDVNTDNKDSKKNKKPDDSSFYNFSDDKIMGNVKKDKDPPVEKDPEKVLDNYLNGAPEIENQISDNNGVSDTKKLPKTDIFSVIDPKDTQEKSKNLQSDNPLLNSEPNNIKTNDELTTEIENLLDKDIDIDAIEANPSPASPSKDTINQPKINPESDMPSALDTTDIADEQKNTNASDDIISSIDTLISKNKDKDLTASVPDAIQDKLSLPSDSFEISKLSTNTTEETGIIPTDNIMGEKPSRNQDTPIIQDTKISVKQPNSEADADTKKIIDLENQDFNCRFEHSIDTVEQTEVFKLMLMPILQTQKPIKMQVKQKLQLYQYLNMDLEDIDNYPSEFSVLRHFCKTMTVQKSVSEDY